MSLSDNGVLTSSSGSPPLGMRGHYIDTKQAHRRMSAVGVNQNKAITKRLASAGHYQQVQSLSVDCCMSQGWRRSGTVVSEVYVLHLELVALHSATAIDAGRGLGWKACAEYPGSFWRKKLVPHIYNMRMSSSALLGPL